MDSQDEAQGAERRKGVRHLACFPAVISRESSEHKHIALIRNVSVTGAWLLTRTAMEAGQELVLALYLSSETDAEPFSVKGRVVRSERRKTEQPDLWPYEAAVEFDTPQTALTEQIEELATRQRELGLPVR